MIRIKRSLRAYPFSFTYCVFINYSMWLGIEHAFDAFFFTLQVNGVFYWYWFSTSYDLDLENHQIIRTNWHGQKTFIPINAITATEVKPIAFGSGHLILAYRGSPYKLKNIARVSTWKKCIDDARWERQELLDRIKREIKRSDKILAKMNFR